MAVTAGLFLANCSAPVDPSDRDLLEYERVWQFCKVFSLYQDRIPSHREALQDFESPGDIVDSLYDTLRSPWENKTTQIGRYVVDYRLLDSTFKETSLLQKELFVNQAEVLRLTDSTLYMRIPEFLENTGKQVVAAARAYEGVPGISNIIVDLIGNRGGYVDACTTVVEAFLPDGVPYLRVRYRDISSGLANSKTVSRVWSSNRASGILEKLKVSILVNKGSASAAEILTIALRDALGTAEVYIVGDWTYGKAIGQYRFPLQSSWAGMSLTGFRFHRIDTTKPDYHEIGIEPDIVFFSDNNGNATFSRAIFKEALEAAVSYWDGQDTYRISAESLYERFYADARSLGKTGVFVELGEQSIPGL